MYCSESLRLEPKLLGIGVWDQLRLEGLRSFAQIFYSMLARKSSGFARILRVFCPKIAYLKKIWGGGGAAAPSPPPPTSYAYSVA